MNNSIEVLKKIYKPYKYTIIGKALILKKKMIKILKNYITI